MKYIKITSLLFLIAGSFSSCLKTANDFAGQRNAETDVVTAISETSYQIADANVLGVGYLPYASFSFTTPATEAVRLFSLHISQPKKKISGSLTVKVTMSALAGYTLPPAAAITVPDIVIPAQDNTGFEVPVMVTVNKATLNPALAYGATFTITSVSQGIYSELEKSVEVEILNSKYMARYQIVSTIKDPAGQYGIDNNSKPVVLNDLGGDKVTPFDVISGSAALQVANLSTGAATNLQTVRYQLDASGNVTSVQNGSNVSLGATIDPSSKFVYTDNAHRTLTLKYTFPFTSVINGVSTTRNISVSEVWTYELNLQAF